MKTLSYTARRVTDALGSLPAVLISVLLMLAWLVWGYTRRYDAFSQLILSSVCSVITFPLFFLILYIQNKDSRATNMKQDEVIRSLESADNRYRRLETAADEVVEELARETC